MAYVRPVDRGIPQVATPTIAAVVVAILIAGVVAFSAFTFLGPRVPQVQGDVVNPALLEAEHQWELRRKQELGYVDPLIEAEREWERQRRQQSLR